MGSKQEKIRGWTSTHALGQLTQALESWGLDCVCEDALKMSIR